MTKILSIENLTVAIGQGTSQVTRLHNISFDLYENEILGLAGESGAGKSLAALSILGLHKEIGGVILDGDIFYWKKGEKIKLSALSAEAYSHIRGVHLGMIFQEASTALNPTKRLGHQLLEAYTRSQHYSKAECKRMVLDILRKVNIQNPDRIYRSYPHEVSGGQAQRVMIAMILCLRPAIIIADEPTSSLDSITQREIIDLLRDLSAEYNFAMIWISHNVPLTRYLCNRIITIQDGHIIENPVQSEVPIGIGRSDGDHQECKKTNQPLLAFNSVSKYYTQTQFLIGKKRITKAVDRVSFVLRQGQLLGLIGKSGSGKSTIAKLITRSLRPTDGGIIYEDTNIDKLSTLASKRYSRDVQVIYQNPEASLDPRWKIFDILNEPLQIHQIYTSAEESFQVMQELIGLLQLPDDSLDRYPHQFSGGQRQRIAIARALLVNPKILICDECIASLDTDNQRVILDLIRRHNKRFQMSVLFISHNLTVVKDLVDAIVILREGKILHHVASAELHSIADTYVKNLLTSCEF